MQARPWVLVCDLDSAAAAERFTSPRPPLSTLPAIRGVTRGVGGLRQHGGASSAFGLQDSSGRFCGMPIRIGMHDAHVGAPTVPVTVLDPNNAHFTQPRAGDARSSADTSATLECRLQHPTWFTAAAVTLPLQLPDCGPLSTPTPDPVVIPVAADPIGQRRPPAPTTTPTTAPTVAPNNHSDSDQRGSGSDDAGTALACAAAVVTAVAVAGCWVIQRQQRAANTAATPGPHQFDNPV